MRKGRFHKQVQIYALCFLIMSFGFINPFFFLGLLFNFSMTLATILFDIPLKSFFLYILPDQAVHVFYGALFP